MAPKPLNHNSADLKNGFSISEYPNKSRICEYVKNSSSQMGNANWPSRFKAFSGHI